MKKSLNFSFFEIWRDHGLTSEKHKVMTFGDFIALEVSKDIFMIQTLHFWRQKIEFVCFPPKYAILGKKG